MQASIMTIVGGLLLGVIGLALEPTIISSAVTGGTSTGIGSFGGVQGTNDLIPLLYNILVISVMIGATVIGGAGVVGRGPMGRFRSRR